MDTRKTIIITREDIRIKLADWSIGKIDEEQIMKWAEEQLTFAHEFGDLETQDEDENSVVREVITSISNLDINLIIKDDIPIYLDFLETVLGQFENGYKIFNEKINSINYDERRNTLRNKYFYSKYC